MGPSVLAIGTALAVVLGTVAVIAWLARRFAVGGGRRDSAGHIEVLSRAGITPKQGLATVRVAGRTALVSYGDGGVRLVMELDGEVAPAPAENETETQAPAFAGVLARARKGIPGLRALGMVVFLTLASLGVPGAVTAQQAAAGSQASQAELQTEGSAQVRAERLDRLSAQAPNFSLSMGREGEEGLQLSGPIGTVIFLGVMTLIPTLLLLMTSFTRILIVLHLLKQALGTQTAPPAHLLAAMALMLTGFVMAPTFEEANRTALQPWMDGALDEVEMIQAAVIPFRGFMLETTRDQDLEAFVRMRGGPAPASIDEVPLVVVTSAFVTSELTAAFQMGFALFLPFVIIDVVVASVLMSMGMFMLPPVMVSLPFKLLLFVLVDGWSLVLGSLVQSF